MDYWIIPYILGSYGATGGILVMANEEQWGRLKTTVIIFVGFFFWPAFCAFKIGWWSMTAFRD